MAKVSKFDAADYLKTPAAIAAYLTEAFETDDPAYILKATPSPAQKGSLTSHGQQDLRERASTKRLRKRRGPSSTLFGRSWGHSASSWSPSQSTIRKSPRNAQAPA